MVAAYLSGRLGEERGGLAEHLRRLGPHGGRAGTTGSCLRGNNKTTTRSTRALAAAERVRDGVTRDESRKRVAGRVERRVRRKTNARGRVSTERRRARSRRRDACFSSPQELSSLISRVAFFAEHEKMIIPSTDKTLHELNTTCSFNPFRISPRPMGSRARRFSCRKQVLLYLLEDLLPVGIARLVAPVLDPSADHSVPRPSRDATVSRRGIRLTAGLSFLTGARRTAARPLETKHPAGREPKASRSRTRRARPPR